MPRTFTLFLTLMAAAPAAAQQTATATLNANFPTVARLSLSTSSLAFPDGDPDLLPLLPSSPPAVTITAKMRSSFGATVTLTIQASGDLRSGLDTIAASNITWAATGPGFSSGTLSRTSPQLVASWGTSGVQTGEQSFRLTNRWTYATGIYTVTMVYTLSAP